ncbi:calcineurin-like phosphoesterase family protein [uncultured Alistipes sp.]|uniref:calcineurin-like phosphoesterase family protein n=1 Tax=uncultured Alistipes sp. TaxID=538949 RepID=UPI002593E17D|nr:calcineurin-like phosphoesterase family protein [uncultured Alistipes sp.]
MKDTIKYLVWIFAIVPFLIACGDSNTDEAPTDDFDVRFELPATVDVAKGGELTFTVKEGKSPQTTDSFLLEGGGISYLCSILSVSSESFTVRLADECESGSYTAYLKRDARKKSIGKIYINIVDKIDFEPSAGTTVFGLVSSEEGPVANVVVSDGTEVTVTDDKGIYELKSAKKWGYVFISVPSGYEVAAEGVFPQFYQTLKGAADVVEQKDFKLTKVDGQDRYKLFLLGDMHLANRTNDAAQFTQFTTDLNAYMAQHSGQKMYALTLGDMTWDLYWYKNNYALPQYRETINRQVKNLQIYHTMGNHDNDFMTTSDYDAAVKYVDCIGPTFYSFNIGQVHYVVMDNIDCSAYDGTDSRNYVKKLSNEQLKWLAKDLAYVDKSTPLIVAMHAQIYKPTSTGFAFDHDSANTEALLAALDGYEVHFVTGHTHKVYNITPDDDVVKGRDIHEHNSGAICASWWWSGNLTPGVHVSIDGAPGGYAIWDIDGTDFAWLYKSTGWPEEYQFRSYDLNNVSFSMDDVPNIPSNVLIQLAYKKYVNAYPENSDNEVLIKIWNWNSNWELSVVDERGKTLEYTPVWAYDPLHIAALSVPRFNNSGITSTPSFVTESATNFFKVKADDADVDLTITVKDEFGHTWTEEMQRPKAFSTDAYKLR